MDIYDLAQTFLKENKLGYDCLYNENGECACDLDDLESCGKMSSACEFGFRNNCEECIKKSICDYAADFVWMGTNAKCFVGKTPESEELKCAQ